MQIDFDADNHVYFVDGQIADINVTTLLQKHGIAPSYQGVNKSILRNAANFGKKVHKDIEDFLNDNKYEPITEEGKAFKEYAKEHFGSGAPEVMLAYKRGNLLVAGTCDLLAFTKKGLPIIADHKTTYAINKEYVSWQVSMLDYMARMISNSGETLNGHKFIWRGAVKFICFHFGKDHKLNVVPLEKIPDQEIERLFDCEAKGEKYIRPQLSLSGDLAAEVEKVEEALFAIEKQRAFLVSREAELRNSIKQAMEAQGITSWTTPNGKVRVSYIHESQKMIVDSAKLKSDYPQVWAKTLKPSVTRAHVQIKITDDEE